MCQAMRGRTTALPAFHDRGQQDRQECLRAEPLSSIVVMHILAEYPGSVLSVVARVFTVTKRLTSVSALPLCSAESS